MFLVKHLVDSVSPITHEVMGSAHLYDKFEFFFSTNTWFIRNSLLILINVPDLMNTPAFFLKIMFNQLA